MDYAQTVRDLAAQHPIDTASAASIFNFVRRVAWELRGDGFGLMEKSYGGEDEFEYQGTRYSLKRIATVDRHYKILSDGGVGGTNGPTWVDEGPLPDRAGVSFKPALPPDDAQPQQGGSSQSHGTLDEAVMALARAQAAELIDESLKPLVAGLNALAAQVGQRAALPTKLALRSSSGNYVAADEGQSDVPLVANRITRGPWETFDIEWIAE